MQRAAVALTWRDTRTARSRACRYGLVRVGAVPFGSAPMQTGHKLQKILARFPWRRRKPRGADGVAPIAFVTKEGRRMWANPNDLVTFEDPGPALVCVAMHEDPSAHALVRGLVQHHADARGTPLPQSGPARTTEGLEILSGLLECAGLDPDETLGPHAVGELVQATWAIAAADVPAGANQPTAPQ